MSSIGRCFLCEKDFTKRGITRHLSTCIKKKLTPGEREMLYISIESIDFPEYWTTF